MKNSKREEQWNEARKRCRLLDEEVRMAREMGLNPLSLIKNIPSPSERWKAPVPQWIRQMYAKRGVRGRPRQDAAERPPIKALVVFPPHRPSRSRPDERPEAVEFDEFDSGLDDVFDDHGPPDSREIAGENSMMLRRQREFRLAAQYVAKAFSRFPEVIRVVLFGRVREALKANLRGERLVRRLIAPRLFMKQLRMTYRAGEIAEIIQQTRFAHSHAIDKISLVGVPAWLRVRLTRSKSGRGSQI